MKSLKQFWRNLRTSLWFVPSLIVAVSIALAMVLLEADAAVGDRWLARWPRLFGADAAGARAMLSTIASSMMTVMGVAFSMTLVTLVLASSQYTSRVLRNFIRDRVTQVVLGIFAGVFTYCLIVLRTISGGGETGHVASVAVSFGVVLAIGGIGALIYFIHHIASSIQASSIIAAVADETMAAVDRLFPSRLGQSPAEGDKPAPALPLLRWQAVPAERNGYIESVDNELLLRLAGSTTPSCGWNSASANSWSMEPRWHRSRWIHRRTTRWSLPCRRPTASAATERWYRIALSASGSSWT